MRLCTGLICNLTHLRSRPTLSEFHSNHPQLRSKIMKQKKLNSPDLFIGPVIRAFLRLSCFPVCLAQSGGKIAQIAESSAPAFFLAFVPAPA